VQASPEGSPVFTVVETHEVDLGTRSIIFNRIEPPTFFSEDYPVPEKPAEPEVAAVFDGKSEVFLSLGCTVYGGRMSEVRCEGPGGEYVFWSGIDFHLFGHFADFETPLARYSLILATHDEPLSSMPKAMRRSLSQFTSGPASHWIVSAPKTGVNPDLLRALDDLYRYFNNHRE
jgi:hypothetical protein